MRTLKAVRQRAQRLLAREEIAWSSIAMRITRFARNRRLLGERADLYPDPVLAWHIDFIRHRLTQRCASERWVQSLIALARKVKGHMDAGAALYRTGVCLF
jgi:hypothetical protein